MNDLLFNFNAIWDTAVKSSAKRCYYDIFDKLSDYYKPSGKLFSDLVSHMESMGFFDSPASTRFHGTNEGDLALHSLGVLVKAASLADIFHVSMSGYDLVYMIVSCLFHDACKAGLYIKDFKNVKDEKTGQWIKQPYFRIKEGSTGCGHGGESLRRISKFVDLPNSWELAVYWHMGSYGLSSDENIQYMNACKAYPEVLLLHTADMLQVSSGGY